MKAGKFDWQARAIQAAFVIVLIALWYYVGRNSLVSPIFLPKLPNVVDKFLAIVQSSTFYGNLGITLFELLVAVAIASTCGLTIGYLVGRSRYAVVVFEPLLASVFAVPLVVFLIALNTIGGISQVDPRFVTVARSMGASERQLFRRVLLPAALPVIVTGLRIGCTIGFLAILGSEMIAGLRGLGSRIVALAEGMNTAEMFAYIVFVIFLAMILNITLSQMQRRFGENRRAA
jgi:ABC-type nitrate/sulfonate/bicarbonate transport system permease component